MILLVFINLLAKLSLQFLCGLLVNLVPRTFPSKIERPGERRPGNDVVYVCRYEIVRLTARILFR